MAETPIIREQPHSIEAEQSVIGSMLMNIHMIPVASEVLTGRDFYNKEYGIIFDSMVELHNEGRPVDLVTLQDKLKSKNVPESVSSMAFVPEVTAVLPSSLNMKEYAQIVSDKSLRRQLIKVASDISQDCFGGKDSIDTIFQNTETKIFGLLSKQTSGEYQAINEVVMEALQKIEISSKSQGRITGVATGFTDLDYKMAGLQPSDLILVAARPSMGKTAFVLNIADYVSIRGKKNVLIFSLEMSKTQLVNRLLAMESNVEAQNLRTGNLSDQDWEKLIDGASRVSKTGLIIDDTPGISIGELRSKSRKYKLEHGVDLIMIDYLQLMSGNQNSLSRQQEIAEISRALKALARELNVPVIALSQLSRAVEARPDHRPVLSDLRESGAIEQDADVVMFIYRDDYYHPDTEKKNIAEIKIAKQRNGPIGTVELLWLPQYTRFRNLQKN